MSIALEPHIEERLRTNEIAWLNTVRPDGRPHSVAVWFLLDGETVLIFTQPHSQKVKNLHQNRHVTLALDDTKLGDDVVVLEGTAELVDIATGFPAFSAYSEKYKEGLQELHLSLDDLAKTYSQVIRITPTRVVTVA